MKALRIKTSNTNVINDLGCRPCLKISGWDNNSLDIVLDNSGGLRLLKGLGCKISLCSRAGVDIGLGLSLGSGQGVFEDLGLVNDLGGDPDTCSGDILHRGIDLCCRFKVCLNLCCSLRHCDRGGDNLSLW